MKINKKAPEDSDACDPAGTRTQDPYIKSVMLYQLSYGICTIVKKTNGCQNKTGFYPLF